jgi:hypothetical protein
MEEQIDKAFAEDTKVEVRPVAFYTFMERMAKIPHHHQKVLLIGGFAGSVSLRKYISDRLERFCRQKNYPLPKLLHPPNTYVPSPLRLE